jgi:single-strand DNA-binding protein
MMTATVQETETITQGLNKVMLIGHLGRSPEMRYTPGGKPVTSFSIVTTYPATSSNGTCHDETDWFNVIVWGALAETCKKDLCTGQRVFIEGRMKTRQWTDADNVQHSCAEVVAQRLIPLQYEPPGVPQNVGSMTVKETAHDFKSNQD